MGKIILNGTEYARSGGSGGHTIVDPTGTDMPQENKLQFTGSVNVSDDAVNGQTVVNVEGGGNVYGAFIDTSEVIKAQTIFVGSMSYTATKDCIVAIALTTQSNASALVKIDGVTVQSAYIASGTNAVGLEVPLKSGQVLTVENANSGNNSAYTVFGITQGTNGIFAPVIYSDNERVIGVWRDGKPLYQKTIDVAPLPNNTTKEIQLDTDIERIISMRGYGIDSNDKWDVFFNDVVPTSVSGSIRVFANTANQKLYINTAQNLTSYTEAYVTIQYTKTTDVAGSGSWNTDGVPTHHYSTNEQVIGTWIDGKPLYEKVVKSATAPSANAWNTVALPADISVKIYDAYYVRTTGAVDKFSMYRGDTSPAEILVCTIENSTVYYRISSQYVANFSEFYITIQYTKTTD